MKELKQTLLSKKDFIYNEYLDKYCELVERHTGIRYIPKNMNRHHIIPRAWFKLNKIAVDNSLRNLVTLSYRDHVLAHYYLCLCTKNELQYANQLALICLLSRNKLNQIDKQLIKQLPLYNNIYESYIKRRNNNFQLYKKGGN